jgi:succinyl-diaminopimelate desuccinylase
MVDVDKILNMVDEKEVIQVTQEMVRIPSLTRYEGLGMVNYMERWCKDLGIPVRIYPYSADRSNFFADFGATSGPGRYMFNGHMDVKPVEGMTVDPWGAVIRDGRMYGRGTCDMKGGIAGVLCAFKALVRSGFKPRGGITFYSDIDEEFGGTAGYYWAKGQGLYDGYEGLVSCEPTEMQVQIGNRGSFVTAFETIGKSAHTGLAFLGINAIHNMIFFINEFLKLPYLKVENPWFGKCTVNFEKIEGGLYLSAVPDRCVACLDSRIIPETPPEQIQKQVDDLMERMNREQGINIAETKQPEGWRVRSAKMKAEAIPADHPLTLSAAAAYEKANGKKAVISACPAITIAMVLIEMGIPAIIFGPGSIAQAHTADEFVPLVDLVEAARSYTVLMAGM